MENKTMKNTIKSIFQIEKDYGKTRNGQFFFSEEETDLDRDEYERYPDIYDEDEPQEEWTTSPSSSGSASGWTSIDLNGDAVAEVYGSDVDSEKSATLFASAPAMLELLKNILAEVRPEISRVNEAAGETIFNPVATETIDMAKELIAKAGGE